MIVKTPRDCARREAVYHYSNNECIHRYIEMNIVVREY